MTVIILQMLRPLIPYVENVEPAATLDKRCDQDRPGRGRNGYSLFCTALTSAQNRWLEFTRP